MRLAANHSKHTPHEPKMCKDNVDLPKEANKAKCFVIACFVLCACPGAYAGHHEYWHMRGHRQY